MPSYGDLIHAASGVWSGIWDAWGGYKAPVLAALAALLVALAARGSAQGTAARGTPRGFGPLAPAAGPFGVAVGWTVLLPVLAAPRLVLHPRGVADHLALPALVALACALALPRAGGRGAVWFGVALAGFTGWWMTGAPAARGEFWRVWAAVAAATAVLALGAGADARRMLAAALALPGALLAVGAPRVWTAAALVPAAASAAVAFARPSTPMMPLAAPVAAAGAAAVLGAGRLVRGAVGAIDLACVLALPAPLLVPALARRLGRFGWLAPPIVAALVAGAAALLARLLRR